MVLQVIAPLAGRSPADEPPPFIIVPRTYRLVPGRILTGDLLFTVRVDAKVKPEQRNERGQELRRHTPLQTGLGPFPMGPFPLEMGVLAIQMGASPARWEPSPS